MPHRSIFAEEAVLKDLPALVDHSAAAYGYNISGTGKGVSIAIVDTGKPDHLAIKNIGDSVNMADSYTVLDTVGQATIVGGIIGANNPEKMIGIAPEATLHFVKVSGDDGKVGLDAFVSGFLWSVIKSVDIVVVPMTTNVSLDIFRDAVKKAVKSNICVVCSAGFYGYEQYPSAYDGVLSVGAQTQNGERAGFSALGKVNAVGTSICSTYVNQNFCVARGSAIATAIVGGLAALVVEDMKLTGQVNPLEAYEKIEALIKGTNNVQGTTDQG